MQHPQFVIITDRSTMKAAWITPATSNLPTSVPTNQTSHIEIVEEVAFLAPHQHLTDQMSDMAGAYSTMESSASGGPGPSGTQPRRAASSPSEVHWRIEADRRAVDNLAQAISRVLSKQKPESWSLSAPQDIHNQLVSAIPKIYVDRLVRVLPKNLTHSDNASILAHFEAPFSNT